MRRLSVVADLCCFLIPSVLLLFFPDLFADAVRKALTGCAFRVIPAVFPFIVVTRFLSKRGVTERIGAFFSPVLSPMLGIPPSLCGAVLLGMLAGFPNGAAACADVFRKGYCTKRQAERAAALCGNASAPFMLYLAGKGVCGDARRGLMLFAVQIAVCLLYACMTRGDKKQNGRMTAETRPLTDALTESIREAAAVTLSISGFIVFFGMCGTVAKSVLSAPLPYAAGASLLELSSGLDACMDLKGTVRLAAAAFAVGFCGISAHFQVTSVLHGAGLSGREYMTVRILSALILPLTALIPLPHQTAAAACGALISVRGTMSVYAAPAALAAFVVLRAAVMIRNPTKTGKKVLLSTEKIGKKD